MERQSSGISHHPHYPYHQNVIVRLGRLAGGIGLACHPNSEYLIFKQTGSLFLVPVVLCAVLRLCSNRLLSSDEFRMMERHVPEARSAELATLHPTGEPVFVLAQLMLELVSGVHPWKWLCRGGCHD